MKKRSRNGRIVIGPQQKDAAPHTPKARRFKRRDEPQPIQLTDRDADVLQALAVHRFLSGEQLRRLVYRCSPSRVRRRLRALYDHRLVERISVVAQPTRGVPPFVYTLSSAGRAALQELGIEAGGGGANGAGLRFVRHKLAVNDVFITLTEAVRETPYQIRDWKHEQELKLPAADGRGSVERVRHPSFPKPLPFLPDGYFELDIGNNQSFAYFVEIDLATHAQRVWRDRALLYSAYADPEAGLFARRFGRQTFRSLIVTTPDYRGRSRCRNILQTIESTVGASDLFLATTLDDVNPEQILGNVWRSPGRARRCSLLQNPARRAVVVRRGRQRPG